MSNKNYAFYIMAFLCLTYFSLGWFFPRFLGVLWDCPESFLCYYGIYAMFFAIAAGLIFLALAILRSFKTFNNFSPIRPSLLIVIGVFIFLVPLLSEIFLDNNLFGARIIIRTAAVVILVFGFINYFKKGDL